MTQQSNNRKKPPARKTVSDVAIYGKVPPQAKPIEEAILGGLMMSTNNTDIVLEALLPECFYVEAHQKIFSAMVTLHSRSQPIDILTVAEQLRVDEQLEAIGGAYYVTKLTNHVVSDAHAEHYSRIVFQAYLKRQMISIGSKLIQDAYEDSVDVFDLVDEIEKDIFSVINKLQKKNYSDTTQLLVKAITEIETARDSKEELSGVSSGFVGVDKMTHGWQRTDLIIIAARPAVGKTALALNLVRNSAKAGTPAALFSLEMSGGQIIRRLMSAESEIPLEKIMKSRLEDDDMKVLYAKAIQPLSGAKIFVDDTAALNIFELRAKVRRLVQKEGVGLVVIDYLQLMSGGGRANNQQQNREQEISEISRNLKRLAKELNIPIIALCQLSRQIENRANKEPQLSDLRESGAIEQDADAVIFVSRPEYYGIHRDAQGESTAGETILKFAKYRNGAIGTVKLRAMLWIQKFTDWDKVATTLEEKIEKTKKGEITKVWTPVDEQVDSKDTTFQ